MFGVRYRSPKIGGNIPSEPVLLPGCWREYQIAAAVIASPSAASELIELGIGPTVISDFTLRQVLADGLRRSGQPDRVLAAAATANPEVAAELGWRVGVLCGTSKRDTWARRDVRRLTVELAHHWLPERLRWIVGKLERGERFNFERELTCLARFFEGGVAA